MEIQLQSSRSLLSFWLVLMIMTQSGLWLENFLKVCANLLLGNACFHYGELLCAEPQPKETKKANPFQSLCKDLPILSGKGKEGGVKSSC